MNVQFYIPLPTVEFFTWFAVYMQFGLLSTLFMSFGVCSKHNNESMMAQALLSSIVLIPALFWVLVTDYKGFKDYFYRDWMETPAEKRKRFDHLYDI